MLDKRDAATLQKQKSLDGLAEEAGHQSARRLTEVINVKTEAEESKVELVKRAEVNERFSFKDVMAAAIFTQAKGDLPGSSFVLIPRDNALRIVMGATGARPDRPVSMSAFTAQIVLKQIGEHLAKTYFEGIAIMLQRAARLRLTAPEVIFDAWDSTLTIMAARLPKECDDLYTFWLRFCCVIGNERCQGVHLYFVDKNLLNIAP
jgi:chemotaxis protein CheY-P-specific phosphatase CheC